MNRIIFLKLLLTSGTTKIDLQSLLLEVAKESTDRSVPEIDRAYDDYAFLDYFATPPTTKHQCDSSRRCRRLKVSGAPKLYNSEANGEYELTEDRVAWAEDKPLFKHVARQRS